METISVSDVILTYLSSAGGSTNGSIDADGKQITVEFSAGHDQKIPRLIIKENGGGNVLLSTRPSRENVRLQHTSSWPFLMLKLGFQSIR